MAIVINNTTKPPYTVSAHRISELKGLNLLAQFLVFLPDTYSYVHTVDNDAVMLHVFL